MEILVAYCADCDLVFDFKNHEKCPECGEIPMELTATSKSRPTKREADSLEASVLGNNLELVRAAALLEKSGLR